MIYNRIIKPLTDLTYRVSSKICMLCVWVKERELNEQFFIYEYMYFIRIYEELLIKLHILNSIFSQLTLTKTSWIKCSYMYII